ncbi:MAG: retropepsin-like aspartic protease [Parvularculales bacterium]
MAMKTKNIVMLVAIPILVAVFVLSGNSNLPRLYVAEYLLHKGHIEQHEYNETLKFDDTLGVIIIPVVVNGVKGRFLLDTGAPNVITPDFAARVSAETGGLFRFTTTDVDSVGNEIKGEFSTLDSVHIGSLSYRDINFLVMPLFPEGGVVSDCLHLDGVIGANLMRKSVWKIDYVNRTIVITNSPDDPGSLTGFDSVPFRPDIKGTPQIDLDIDGVAVKDIKFDTGSNGHLSILKAYQSQFPADPGNEFYVDGRVQYGAGGKSQQTRTGFRVFDKVQIGPLSFDDETVEFNEYSAILGNRILKNYDIILDWTSSEILLKEVKKYQDRRNFDFVMEVRSEGIFVTGLYSHSAVPLLAGDQIVFWNGTDIRSLSGDQTCKFLSASWRGNSSGDVNLRVIRDSEEIPVTWVRN